MTHPNYIIIGAAKSGTTSISAYCSQHPEVFVSPMKEARFLAYDGELAKYRGYGRNGEKLMSRYDDSLPRSLEEYLELFKDATENQKTGEASPAYLYVKDAPVNISNRCPNAKLIAVLRNPVERAFSSYLHLRRDDAEDLSFEDALAAESDRIKENSGLLWRYLDLGYYGEQIERYHDTFGASQLKVILYEDLAKDPMGQMAQIFDFIGVDSGFTPDVGERLNVSGIPRSQTFYRGLSSGSLLNRASKFIPSGLRKHLKRKVQKALLEKPTLDPKLRQHLIEAFRKDIVKLDKLIGRDLSKWLI